MANDSEGSKEIARCGHRIRHFIPRRQRVRKVLSVPTAVLETHAPYSYDRYWMGRVIWSDLTKTSRTMGRLIWFHVPLRSSPDEEPKEEKEVERLMREKRLALDLIEG